jgi:hypothetical protein
MAFAKPTQWLMCILCYLFSLQLCNADDGNDFPNFKFPLNTGQQAKDEMNLALKDAMTLARFVAITSIPCNEVRVVHHR